MFERYLYITLYENPPTGSQVVPCGHTHTHTHTQKGHDEALVAFRSFTKAPKNVPVVERSDL
jgi:hypothetical protein